MKKQRTLFSTILTLAAAFTLLAAFAPNPPAPPKCFHYQAVVRNSAGAVLAGQPVSLRVSFLPDSLNPAAYTEKHTATTDQFGMVRLRLGCGSVLSGSFDDLDWGANDYWVKIEIDPEGGNDFSLLSESKLLAVPVARWAENSRDWVNVGDTVLFTQVDNIGIGVANPQYKLSVGGKGAFGSRVYPGLNGTEGNYSLIHFKNGTDIQGGIVRASKGDDDIANAPLFYQGASHRFQTGNVVIDKASPSLTFLNNNGKAYYWEMSAGVYYLYDPSLSKYRLFFHDNGRVGIGTENPQGELHVNGALRSNI